MEYKPEHLAAEAERLLKDPILNHALKDIRNEALDDLSRTDANDTGKVIALQQRAILANEILDQLQRYIIAIGTE